MSHHLKAQLKKISIVQTLSGVVSNTAQLTALALTATLMLGHYLIIPFVNPYLQFNVGFNNQQTPMIYYIILPKQNPVIFLSPALIFIF